MYDGRLVPYGIMDTQIRVRKSAFKQRTTQRGGLDGINLCFGSRHRWFIQSESFDKLCTVQLLLLWMLVVGIGSRKWGPVCSFIISSVFPGLIRTRTWLSANYTSGITALDVIPFEWSVCVRKLDIERAFVSWMNFFFIGWAWISFLETGANWTRNGSSVRVIILFHRSDIELSLLYASFNKLKLIDSFDDDHSLVL